MLNLNILAVIFPEISTIIRIDGRGQVDSVDRFGKAVRINQFTCLLWLLIYNRRSRLDHASFPFSFGSFHFVVSLSHSNRGPQLTTSNSSIGPALTQLFPCSNDLSLFSHILTIN